MRAGDDLRAIGPGQRGPDEERVGGRMTAMSIEERSRERRRRMVAHRATSWEDAERWDLEFWQSVSPEDRLSALVAIRRDVELVEAGRDRDPEEP